MVERLEGYGWRIRKVRSPNATTSYLGTKLLAVGQRGSLQLSNNWIDVGAHAGEWYLIASSPALGPQAGGC